MVRVVVVDDHDLVRSTVRKTIDRHPDIEVVGEADSGEAGLELVRTVNADVVIVDSAMPGWTARRRSGECSQ
jgi:two-component system, NarL family, invasion response regulator UvrY